jgi:hypothetical protein
MKKIIMILLLLYVCNNIHAQVNIVSNGDFEYYSTCPTAFSQTSNCTGWRQYTGGTSDFFHTCGSGTVQAPNPFFGYQQPASGKGYLGGYSFTSVTNPTTYTEYIAGSIAALIPGYTYEVSMSVSLANTSGYGNNGLGMWFYKTGPASIAPFTTLTVTPQLSFASYGVITDTQNWVRLTAQFKADSAYTDIVIGTFIPSSGFLTSPVGSGGGYSYYYFDSVWIRIATGINNLYKDSTLCAGDTFKIPFTINSGTVINPGNVYTAYLSDPSGSFASGTTVVGTLTGTGPGTITCVVPTNIQPSADYRVRIRSSNSNDSSDPNIHKIAIGVRPLNAKANVDMPICEGDAIHLYGSSSTPGVKYTWTGPNGYTSNNGDNQIPGALASKHNGKYVMMVSSYNCFAWDSTTLTIYKYPEGLQASAPSPICVRNIITLTASTTTPGTKFTWTGPCNYTSNDSVNKIDNCTTCNGGTYTVTANRDGCKKTTTVDVKIIDAVVDLGPDEIMCMNETRLLKLENANATYIWHDGSTASEYTVTKPGIYWVAANTECGILRDTVTKEYEICECKPFVPSAFTPNGDGLNDKIGLTYIDCKPTKLEFMIVNRFGEAVFKTTDPKQKWDGIHKSEPAEVGTYYYQLKVTGPRNKEFFFKGDIALIR